MLSNGCERWTWLSKSIRSQIIAPTTTDNRIQSSIWKRSKTNRIVIESHESNETIAIERIFMYFGDNQAFVLFSIMKHNRR